MPLSTSAILPAGTTIDTSPLNTAFTNHAVEINRIAAYLPAGAAAAAAATAATANALALRDINGSIAFNAGSFAGNVTVGTTFAVNGASTFTGAVAANGGLSAVVPAAGIGLNLKQASVGATTPFVRYFDSDGATQRYAVDWAGNVVAAAITATSVTAASGFVGTVPTGGMGINLKLATLHAATPFLRFFDSDGATQLAAVDGGGNGIFNTVTATSFHGVADSAAALTGISAGLPVIGNGASAATGLAGTSPNQVLVWNGSAATWGAFSGAILTDRTLPLSKLSDLSLSGTGTTLVLTYAPGSFVNSSGIDKTVGAGTTITLTAPTTGLQWAVVYLNDAAAPQSVLGTVGGTRDTALLPATSAFAPFWVLMPQNCVGIYSSQADWTTAGSPANKGYVDQRPNGGAGGGGGGGGTATASTVTTATGDAVLADLVGNYLPTDVTTRIAPASSTQMQLQAGNSASSGLNSPLTLAANGRWRKITAAISATASGAAGVRYIVADLSGGSAFALVSPMPSSLVGLGSYQVALAAVWWDGAALQPGVIDVTNVVNLGTGAITEVEYVANNGGSDGPTTGTATTTLTPPANMGIIGPILIPTAMKARIEVSAEGPSHGLPTGEYFKVSPVYSLNGAAWQKAGSSEEGSVMWGTTGTTTVDIWQHGNGLAKQALTPGSWRFSLGESYFGASGTPTLTLYSRVIRVVLYKG